MGGHTWLVGRFGSPWKGRSERMNPPRTWTMILPIQMAELSPLARLHLRL